MMKGTGKEGTDKDNQNNELLSALMDGEVSEFELHRALQELDGMSESGRQEALSSMSYWQMIGDSLRAETDLSVQIPKNAEGVSLADAVRMQLQNEGEALAGGVQPSVAYVGSESNHASVKGGAKRWLKPVSGMAVAASVAAMVVFTQGNYSPSGVVPSLGDDGAAQIAQLSVDGTSTEGRSIAEGVRRATSRSTAALLGGADESAGVRFVSAESVKTIRPTVAQNDEQRKLYSPYFMLHGASNSYQQNGLLPMVRVNSLVVPNDDAQSNNLR